MTQDNCKVTCTVFWNIKSWQEGWYPRAVEALSQGPGTRDASLCWEYGIGEGGERGWVCRRCSKLGKILLVLCIWPPSPEYEFWGRSGWYMWWSAPSAGLIPLGTYQEQTGHQRLRMLLPPFILRSALQERPTRSLHPEKLTQRKTSDGNNGPRSCRALHWWPTAFPLHKQVTGSPLQDTVSPVNSCFLSCSFLDSSPLLLSSRSGPRCFK